MKLSELIKKYEKTERPGLVYGWRADQATLYMVLGVLDGAIDAKNIKEDHVVVRSVKRILERQIDPKLW